MCFFDLKKDTSDLAPGFHAIDFVFDVSARVGIGTAGIDHPELVSLGGPAGFLRLCADVDAGIGFGSRHDIRHELKVLEVVIIHLADVEQVRLRATRNQRTILAPPSARIFRGFTAVQSFAIEQRLPSMSGIAE